MKDSAENIIKDLRNFLKCSQDELADKLGISREMINKMENGKAITFTSLN